jgi:fructokinase
LGVTVHIDTDVSTATLGEYYIGAVAQNKNFAYITVGTGIGAGFIINNKIVHGLAHPKFGHVRIPHDINKDPFPSVYPYHKDCLEDLTSGLAIEARWQSQPQSLPKDHAAWQLEAEYLSLGLVNLDMCNLSRVDCPWGWDYEQQPLVKSHPYAKEVTAQSIHKVKLLIGKD